MAPLAESPAVLLTTTEACGTILTLMEALQIPKQKRSLSALFPDTLGSDGL